MRVRLNGWQADRDCALGAVGNSGRAVGIPLATQEAVATPKSCISQPYFDDDACSRTMDIRCGVTRSLASAVIMTGLVPILIVWLLVYIVVWTMRWIRRGFQPT
jgi:hypothetical protein